MQLIHTLGWLYNVEDKDCGSLTTDPATLERPGGLTCRFDLLKMSHL